MKIGIQTWGSDGDILPLLALAGGLRAAGHEVQVVYTSVDGKDYSELADRMDFKAVGVPDRLVVDEEILAKFKRCLLKEKWPINHLRAVFDDFYLPAVEAMWESAEQLCRNSDLVIGHWCVHTIQSAAEVAHIPCLAVTLNHSGIPSRYTTPIGLPDFGDWFNPFWWKLVDRILNWGLLPYYNPLRRQEGLQPYRSVIRDFWESGDLNLIAVNPSLCQRQPDWQKLYQICGFLNLPVDLVPRSVPASLQSFLFHGGPPVYMTYGSMTSLSDDYERLVLQHFQKAADLAGCRAIIQTRLLEEGVNGENQNIYFINRIPHTAIFPHCLAVVHHGGSGTTQTAVLTGRPSVVVAHITDQLFWGSELYRLGIAARPLMRQSFSVRKLAERIQEVVNDQAMQKRAGHIGSQARQENGVDKAVAIINRQYS